MTGTEQHGSHSGIGIDFGGVMMPYVQKAASYDTDFRSRFLAQQPREGALSTFTWLVEVFDEAVWIVSKAGVNVERLTRKCFEINEVFNKTKLPSDHLILCRNRLEKAEICSRLEIKHFVDDRIHIMQTLKPVVTHLYLFGDKAVNRSARHWTTLCSSWSELESAIRSKLD